jgi:hypothetical protein
VAGARPNHQPIKYCLEENLKKQGSTRVLNEDEGKELDKCVFMFLSVQRLMGVDKESELGNAELVGQVKSLIHEVQQQHALRPVMYFTFQLFRVAFNASTDPRLVAAYVR